MRMTWDIFERKEIILPRQSWSKRHGLFIWKVQMKLLNKQWMRNELFTCFKVGISGSIHLRVTSTNKLKTLLRPYNHISFVCVMNKIKNISIQMNRTWKKDHSNYMPLSINISAFKPFNQQATFESQLQQILIHIYCARKDFSVVLRICLMFLLP